MIGMGPPDRGTFAVEWRDGVSRDMGGEGWTLGMKEEQQMARPWMRDNNVQRWQQ